MKVLDDTPELWGITLDHCLQCQHPTWSPNCLSSDQLPGKRVDYSPSIQDPAICVEDPDGIPSSWLWPGSGLAPSAVLLHKWLQQSYQGQAKSEDWISICISHMGGKAKEFGPFLLLLQVHRQWPRWEAKQLAFVWDGNITGNNLTSHMEVFNKLYPLIIITSS